MKLKETNYYGNQLLCHQLLWKPTIMETNLLWQPTIMKANIIMETNYCGNQTIMENSGINPNSLVDEFIN